MAAEAGQLQLNYAEPLIVYNMLSNLRMMTNACHMLTERCIRQITANKDRCEAMVRNSIGIVTAFNPYIGYYKATEIAKKALVSDRNVIDIIKEEGLLDDAKVDEILKPENLTGPMSLLNPARSTAGMNREMSHMRVSSVDASFFNMNVLEESDGMPPSPRSGHRRLHSAAPKFPSATFGSEAFGSSTYLP